MILTDAEKITLEIFTADEATFNLIIKLAKDKIDRNREVFVRNLRLKKELTNEEIGAKIRSFDEGTLLVEDFFREIAQLKKKPQEAQTNPAR